MEQLQRELAIHKENYAAMNQVDRLSGEGNMARESINVLTGKIQGMTHILNMMK